MLVGHGARKATSCLHDCTKLDCTKTPRRALLCHNHHHKHHASASESHVGMCIASAETSWCLASDEVAWVS